MTVSRHLEEAAARLQEAEAHIARARENSPTLENQRAWLEALTVYCKALTDIHTYNNESIHEKLHELAGATGLKKFRSRPSFSSLDDRDSMTTLPVDKVQQNGQVIWEAFPSWAQFTWLYLLSAVSALRGAMLFRLGVEGWQMWMLGTVMLCFCAVILRRWAHFELTSERVIVRNGYTGREISSVPLADVRAVTVQQGIVAGFFEIGTLTISSSSTDRVISLRGIRDPEDVKLRIQASALRQSRTAAIPVPQGEL